MKIGFVLYKFGSEEDFGTHLGSYHYVVKKLQTLEKMGADIVIIAPWVSLFKKGSISLGRFKIIRYWPPLINQVTFFPFNIFFRNFYIWMTQRVVLRATKHEKIDIVYVRQARETGYAVSKIKEKLGVPFVFRQITAWHWHFQRSIAEIFQKNKIYQASRKLGIHSFFEKLLSFAIGKKANIRFAKEIYEKADRLVFSTNGAAREGLELGLDFSKVMLLPEAIEEYLFRPMSDKDGLRSRLGISDKKTVLFVGRIINAEKGIDYLINAVIEAKKKLDNIQLLIIGGGPSSEIEHLLKTIDTVDGKDYILYLGKKTFSEVPLYINASDVVCVPSVWMEAFGRITVETMGCGVPVITSNAGGSPEVNIDSETGIVVKAKNADELSSAILKIILDSSLAKQLGDNGRKRVLENYTYEKVVKRFLYILEKVYNLKK